MKRLIIFLVCFAAMHTYAQNDKTYILHSGASVMFADNKWYTGRVLSEANGIIKVEFLHSRSVYQFNSQGSIISSTGKYAVGQKVKQINVGDHEKEVYEDTAWYTVKEKDFLGVLFPDGQDYFGVVTKWHPGYFVIVFAHSGNVYDMIKDKMGPNNDYKGDNKWKVSFKPTGGMYPRGTEIISLYKLKKRVFYSDGTGFNAGVFTESN